MPRLSALKWIILLIFTTATRAYHPKKRSIYNGVMQNIKSVMNEKADPCMNFYDYACGNWQHKIPEHRDFTDTIGRAEYKMNLKLSNLLEKKNLPQRGKNNDIFNKVLAYYETCKEQNIFQVKEYLKIIKPLENEEWPKDGENWLPKGEAWNVWHSLGRLLNIGFNGFLLNMDMQKYNASHFWVYVNKMQHLGFSSYEQYLVDEMEDSFDSKTRLMALKITNFIRSLASLNENHQENFYQQFTIKELQWKVRNIDFETYFSAVWGLEFLPDLRLKVANLPYFQQLAVLLQNTDTQTLIHTLKLKFLGYMIKRMPLSAEGVNCLQHMRELVPLALDYIYDQQLYSKERHSSDKIIQEMFKRLKKNFFQTIKSHFNELSLRERNFLSEKLDLMQLNIGNLPLLTNVSYYVEYFTSWQVYKGDLFYWNHVNALHHSYTELYNIVKRPWFKPTRSYLNWPFATPVYQPATNLIVLPFAYLQYPIYHKDFDKLFLYAELGNSLAHEMLHAFDINGLQFDSKGNPSSLLMINLPDKRLFMNSLTCLQQLHPVSVDEMIADISGFRLAYDTYFQHRQAIKKESTKRLFFIKFAQFFCTAQPSYDGTHDGASFRVHKVVTSHPEFEEIFKCQKNITKRHAMKCNSRLW